MREWLTIELLLGTLLVTAFTCVGLLALWAATSKRHWFLRTSLWLAAISAVLLVPAYEIFVAFFVQSLFVILGVRFYCWWSGNWLPPDRPLGELPGDNGTENLVRYSLATFLLTIPLVAIGTAVAMRLPRLNAQAWTTVVMDGIAAGSATVVAAAVFAMGRWRTPARIASVLLCISMSVVTAFFDEAIPSITDSLGSWPPETPSAAAMLGIAGSDSLRVAWFFIPIIVAMVTALLILAWRTGFSEPTPETVVTGDQNLNKTGKRAARVAFVAMSLSACFFPLFVLFKLLTPDPIPLSQVPQPNAYDEIIDAGKLLGPNGFDGNLDVETATIQQLLAEVQACPDAYAKITQAVNEQSAVPLTYTESDIKTDEMISFRRLARALYGKGRLAELQKRMPDAAECYRQAIQLGYAIRRNGLLIDALVGIACSGFGTGNLYHLRNQLSNDELGRSIALLAKLDATDEPYNDLWYREHIWGQRANGWHGHLQQLLAEIVDYRGMFFPFFLSGPKEHPFAYRTFQATIRLLICELAVAQFHQTENRWPTSLNELVPKYLARVPLDPFASEQDQLKYKTNAIGYLLYSVGRNGVDDDGVSPVQDENANDVAETGDLRLDTHFKRDTSSGVQSVGNASLPSGNTNESKESSPAEEVTK